jgi:peptide/nickel transport system substrate-binding protein
MTTTMAVSHYVFAAIYEPFHTELDYNMQNNLFEDLPTLENGLAIHDDGGTPDDTSDDQLTMSYTIKEGIFWCDGEEVDAEDFVFMYETGLDPDSQITSRAAIDNIESYTADPDDKYSFTVVLNPGVLDPLYPLAYDPIDGRHPLPKHLLEGMTPEEMNSAEEVLRTPCGYGPYTGSDWIAGDLIELTANPYYYKEGKPCSEKLIFRYVEDTNQLLAQLAAGEVDAVTSDALSATQTPLYEQFEVQGLLNIYELPSPTWEHIDMNPFMPTTIDSPSRIDNPHPILSDINVRHAIAYCTDRQGMVDNIYAGKSLVMHSWIPSTNWAYAGDENITIYPYDPEEGMRVLDEAGWVDADGDGVREKDGVRLSLTIRTTSGNVMRERLTQLFEQNQADCGIEIIIDLLPGSVWFGDETGLQVGDFELGEYAWVGEMDPGGRTIYACDQICSPTPFELEGYEGPGDFSGQNFAGWCNPVATEAIILATEGTLIQEERKEAYLILQQEYTKDLPTLPLFNRLEIFGSTPDFEINPNPTEPYFTWMAGDFMKPPE